MESYIGQITMYGFNWAPRDWAVCGGQLIQISQYQALYSLIGTIYGGDGRITFQLPDMRARSPVGWGDAPGLQNYPIGTRLGHQLVALTETQLPKHSHSATFIPSGGGTGGGIEVGVAVSKDDATSSSPLAGGYLATTVATGGAQDKPENIYRPDAGTKGVEYLGGVQVSGGGGGSGGTVVLADTGLGQSFSIVQPVQITNFCITMEGVYPPRN
ncbi:hypothetical protein BTA51_23625 [Hahella sp. CCB-MM4]|uniref:phage tail protein n=1 Tax=Hahella sp. (strain CCB-MM4) TaxID=1926491 RepID=UPI000B9BC241|nr:tail fiber protein [Hahella sp. CCB-MM4]OZG70832.1 hypothetical protein BTA51_23625 [Hahella sp. CCB-MM4]